MEPTPPPMKVDDALKIATDRELKNLVGSEPARRAMNALAAEVLRLRAELARAETELDELHRAHELNSHE